MSQLPPPPPSEDWYVVHGQDGRGHPVDRNTLRQWAKQGRITPNHQIYSERTNQWLHADELPSLFQEPQHVVVTDIKMSFGSMIVFMVKWGIAAIPAVIILAVLFAIILSSIFAGVGGR